MIPANFDSLSSSLMTGVTLFKNRSSGIIAEAGYVLAFAVSIIETLAALICVPVSAMFYPLSDKPLNENIKWLQSAAFCVVWSLADIFMNLNPLIGRLIADEAHARMAIRNPLSIPHGTLV